LTAGDGTKTVYAKFKDSAGNWMIVPCSGSITLDTLPPLVAEQMPQMSAISASDSHTLAIAADGSLWTWGINQGNLGDGTTVPSIYPESIGAESTWGAVQRACIQAWPSKQMAPYGLGG